MSQIRHFGLLSLAAPICAAELCFDDGIPESQRKDLVESATGELFPVGVWVNDWTAGHLTATMAQIMIKEKLGINAELKGPGVLANDGIYAMTGCTAPNNPADRGCGPSRTYVHVNVEVWTLIYPAAWAEIQVKYPETAPKNLGSMGYYGQTAQYVPSKLQERIYEAEGIHLDFFRDYNVSRVSAGRHFANPLELNTSKLLPCSDTALMSNEVMTDYVNVTGDLAGVVVGRTGELQGRCFDSYFWYAPACRPTLSSCLTWLTAGNGWGMYEMLVKATVYDMPIATAVASSMENWGQLSTEHDLMLYWWVPDPTFLRLEPKRVVFPPYNRDEWARGDRRSAARDDPIDKHVSRDLSRLAPEVEGFIGKLVLSLQQLNQMMLDQLDTKNSNFDVVCRWLRANPASWSAWLPEKGKCFPQFGMYNDVTEQFLDKRENVAISCKACPSGFYSKQLKDDEGLTYICVACEPGSFQESGASVACNVCPAGSYQDKAASLSCNRCPVGTYQQAEGASGCMECPKGTSTRLLGSTSVEDCGCEAGSINVANQGIACLPCPRGLECPQSSTVQSLKSGKATEGRETVPQIEQGYYSIPEEPLEILRCRPSKWCPGGRPGTCAGGLKGTPCAFCPEGETFSGEKCVPCGSTELVALVLSPFILAAPIIAYYFTNSEVLNQPTPLKALIMAFGIGVGAMQILAVIGLMSAKWPGSLAATSSRLQIFRLDLSAIGMKCLSGNDPLINYLITLCIFPAVIGWLLICYFASLRLPRVKPWKWQYTINTIGLGLQLTYGTMASLALEPFMCFAHPNGRQSLIIHPDLFCGEGKHQVMQALGVGFLMIFVVGFFALCWWAAWKLPSWPAKSAQKFRFFVANFRFDSHWFILMLLLRGLCLALSVVFGSNLPPLQTALASITLSAYGVMQATIHPWRVRLINLADTLATAILLLLVNRTIQIDREMETKVADIFTLCFLLLLLSILVLAVALSALALLLQRAGGDWRGILSLGKVANAYELSTSLTECADRLMEIQASELAGKLAGANSYDVRNVMAVIEFFSEIFGSAPMSSKSGRVNPAVMNRSSTIADPSLSAPRDSGDPSDEERGADVADDGRAFAPPGMDSKEAEPNQRSLLSRDPSDEEHGTGGNDGMAASPPDVDSSEAEPNRQSLVSMEV